MYHIEILDFFLLRIMTELCHQIFFLVFFKCIFASITTLDNGLSLMESRAVNEGHVYPSALHETSGSGFATDE
jgi:hypothetical protein